MRFTEHTVAVDGHDIFYRVAGPADGPVMVHVHGFAVSGRYLMPTAELLATRYRNLVPDLPGHGRSSTPPATLGIGDLAAVLDRFLDTLGVARATFVGNSMGCAITAELIARHPGRVERAVMVGLAGGRFNRPLAKAVWQLARDGLAEPPQLLPVVAPDYLRYGPARALKMFSLMTRFPIYERFMAIDVPTMIVIGSEDPLHPPWQRIGRVIDAIPPTMSVVLFQGAAHAINFSHPRELASAIRQYMDGEEVRMDAANPDGLPVLELKRPG